MAIHTHVISLTGIFACIAVFASIQLILRHKKTFTKPNEQRKIIGILFMVPIYSFDSWLSVVFPLSAPWLDMFRDVYEGYVLYLFLALMFDYVGNNNRETILKVMAGLPPLYHPPPVSWISPEPIRLDYSFLRDCKHAALQYSFLKPVFAVIAIVLECLGVYCEGSYKPNCGYFWNSFFLNISVSYAFYYLVLFYIAFHEPLAPYKPTIKFICIKSVLFLSFWQSVFINGLLFLDFIPSIAGYESAVVATAMQNIAITFEMMIISFGHMYAFPTVPYISGDKINTTLLSDNFGSIDAMRDWNEVMPAIVFPTGFTPGVTTISTRTAASYTLEGLADE